MGTIPERCVEKGWGWTELARDSRLQEAQLFAQGAWTRCVNTQSLGRKPEELDVPAQLQGCDLFGITGTVWHSTLRVRGFKLFWRSRQGNEWKLCYTQNSFSLPGAFPCFWDKPWSSWELRDQNWWGDWHGKHCGGTCCKLSDQEEEAGEALKNKKELTTVGTGCFGIQNWSAIWGST